MATYTKHLLSGSSYGKQIKIAATTTPGTLIHTASADAGVLDEVWIYCVNSQTAAVGLTIEWGEVTVPDGNIECSVPGESGLMLIIPGLILTNELVIRAFAGTANVLLVSGFVNRITP